MGYCLGGIYGRDWQTNPFQGGRNGQIMPSNVWATLCNIVSRVVQVVGRVDNASHNFTVASRIVLFDVSHVWNFPDRQSCSQSCI